MNSQPSSQPPSANARTLETRARTVAVFPSSVGTSIARPLPRSKRRLSVRLSPALEMSRIVAGQGSLVYADGGWQVVGTSQLCRVPSRLSSATGASFGLMGLLSAIRGLR
jgi:hypothetical protein